MAVIEHGEIVRTRTTHGVTGPGVEGWKLTRHEVIIRVAPPVGVLAAEEALASSDATRSVEVEPVHEKRTIYVMRDGVLMPSALLKLSTHRAMDLGPYTEDVASLAAAVPVIDGVTVPVFEESRTEDRPDLTQLLRQEHHFLDEVVPFPNAAPVEV